MLQGKGQVDIYELVLTGYRFCDLQRDLVFGGRAKKVMLNHWYGEVFCKDTLI